MPTTPKNLIALVEKFDHPRIMLVGDIMIDEYIYGDAERLSPEAPVPVIQERYREHRAGGAGNVAAGLAALGAHVLIVSICGNDHQGKLLLNLFQKMSVAPGAPHGNAVAAATSGGGVATAGILACDDRPTTSKTRLVGLAQHRHPQQMLRLDQEITTPITAQQQEKLLSYLRVELPSCQALALEDYNKGLLTPALCQEIIAIARSLRKPVLVDPALIADYSKYNGASTITPNRFEAERAAAGDGLKLANPSEQIPLLAQTLLKKHNLETCLLTLDRQGMYLLEASQADSGGGVPIPTRPRNVYDVTGAGDMVLAALTMAIASGASWLQAAHLANIAGGLEVEKFGIVPITKDEIIGELHRLDTDAHGKERTLPHLLQDLKHHQKAGKQIVFTNGVFDILHAGHVQYLNFSRKQGDLLIVAVNTDNSVRRLKGPSRPVNPLADRLAVLAALQCVDYLIPFDEDTPAKLIEAIQPDILVKGQDYENKEVVGRNTVEKKGGKVILAPLLQGRSTTNVINKTKA